MTMHGGSVAKAHIYRCQVKVPAAETSTHLESASASHQGAAASLLDQSELQWRPRFTGGRLQRPDRAVKLSPRACWRQRQSTHLESATTSHRGAATTLLEQSELQGGPVVRANTILQVPFRVPAAQMSTHLEFASNSYREAAASLLDQVELHDASIATDNI